MATAPSASGRESASAATSARCGVSRWDEGR
jgi:hypothetical protein